MSSQYSNEIELVKGLKNKDNFAIAHLYSHYSVALKKVISEILLDIETTEDVFQQSMISIWQKIDLYDSNKGRLFTWMLNICRNGAIDKLRSKGFRQTQNQVPIDGVYELSTSDTGLHIDGIGLKKILLTLPDDLRKPLMMNYLEGYTHEEISVLLQWPLGTVKTRIRNAIIQLRKKMTI